VAKLADTKNVKCFGVAPWGYTQNHREIAQHYNNNNNVAGEFHDQGDAKWIVIRLPLRGRTDTHFGRLTPGVGLPSGVQGNLSLTNLRAPTILFFIAGILLMLGLFTIELTTEGLEIKFFKTGISLLKGSLY
jgi:hypothetical protein